MIEYQKQWEFYSFPESIRKTKKFFEKYWLFEEELTSIWLPKQEKIYDCNLKEFPGITFQSEFYIIPFEGGITFTESDFNIFKECLFHLNEKSFVVIQDYDSSDPPYNMNAEGKKYICPPLRFKFPSDVNWDDLMNGGYISIEMFQTPYNQYFIFGESCNFGLYVANDPEHPFNLVGFKKEFSSFFREKYRLTDQDYEYIKNYLPDIYLNRL